MIATPHTLASTTGLDVLRDGGSAVDAAIAANAVLCVAYPHMAGLGSDGFWMIAPPDEAVTAINASGPAAERATREFYRDDGHDEIPERGPAAALTVPGAVDGWRLAHETYGELSWDRLFEDAIGLADDGLPITENLSRWAHRDRDVLAADERAAATFLDGGSPPPSGSTLVQPELATSLSTLATVGPRDGFYGGEVAAEFCAGLGAASPLAPSDFEAYSATWVDPLSVDYGEYTAHGVPPNTQGLAALQILGLLDGFDVAAWGDGSADYYHHMAEATKLAFADRDAWVTDPGFVDVPTDELLDVGYLRSRADLIAPDETLTDGEKGDGGADRPDQVQHQRERNRDDDTDDSDCEDDDREEDENQRDEPVEEGTDRLVEQRGHISVRVVRCDGDQNRADDERREEGADGASGQIEERVRDRFYLWARARVHL